MRRPPVVFSPQRIFLAAAILATILLTVQPVSATWSIVAVDRATREVGSSGASCVGWVANIVGVAPGRGVIVAQAMSNMDAKRRSVDLLAARTNPADVLKTIVAPGFDASSQERQYGIVALDFDRAVAFTGNATGQSRGDRQGPDFSVQGNILAGPEVLERVFGAFTASVSRGVPLAERLLSALEAGAAAGGDSRCGRQTALASYLVVARPTDPPGEPSMRLIVPAQPAGGPNPVILLREMFERSKAR